MKSFYIGSCAFCDFEHRSDNPIECNMAIIRHHCERKYQEAPMTEPVAPAAVSDPHRSLIRSVRGVFENMHRVVNGFSGDGDIIAVATAALANAGHELAALLDAREMEAAAYVARMEADTALVADVNAQHESSPAAVALNETASQVEGLSAAAAPAPEAAPVPDPVVAPDPSPAAPAAATE